MTDGKLCLKVLSTSIDIFVGRNNGFFVPNLFSLNTLEGIRIFQSTAFLHSSLTLFKAGALQEVSRRSDKHQSYGGNSLGSMELGSNQHAENNAERNYTYENPHDPVEQLSIQADYS